MTRSGVSRSTVLFTGIVALVYTSLAAVVAICALRHVDPSNGHSLGTERETDLDHSILKAYVMKILTLPHEAFSRFS